MTDKYILMIIGTSIVAISGCAAESSAMDTAKTQVAEADIAASSESVDPNSIGQFHIIRLSNTNFCIQPQGGSTGDVSVELRQCNSTAGAQNWLFVSQSGGREIVNQQSGMCLYNGAEPPTDGGRPITHSPCNVFGGTAPASNSLWKPSSLTGFTRLMSELGHRDTGFCLDVPNGNAFDGAALQIFHCNGTPQQTWVVGVE